MSDHDLGHLCRGGRVQMSGHSDFGKFQLCWSVHQFLTWEEADTASAACSAHPGCLAVMCDADEPCTVTTA